MQNDLACRQFNTFTVLCSEHDVFFSFLAASRRNWRIHDCVHSGTLKQGNYYITPIEINMMINRGIQILLE